MDAYYNLEADKKEELDKFLRRYDVDLTQSRTDILQRISEVRMGIEYELLIWKSLTQFVATNFT
jgi:hypothetical protein